MRRTVARASLPACRLEACATKMRSSSLGVVEHEPFDLFRLSRIKARAEFDRVAIGVADENRNMAIAECHRTLRDPDSIVPDVRDGSTDVGDAKGRMGEAGVFFRHVHKDVLAACLIDAIDDQV